MPISQLFSLTRRTVGVGLLLVALSAVAVSSSGSKTTLHSFAGSPDGAYPYSPLTLLPSGALAGTTTHGGAYGYGAVYRITRKGVTTILHSFAQGGGQGAKPTSGVTVGSDGFLYGMTSYGGKANLGVVYQLKLNGRYKVLHEFDGLGGATPTESRLVEGNDGALYGVTWLGGPQNMGLIFRLTKRGKYSVLHEFVFGPQDGVRPSSDLVRGSDRYFYGTCGLGGAGNFGTLFRFNEAGDYETLASFGGSNVRYPGGHLVADDSGAIYGTGRQGGDNQVGGVFKFTPAVGLSTLYSFPDVGQGGGIGFYPEGGLTLAADGKMYGTTEGGGDNLMGSIYRIDAAGTVEPVYSFLGYSDGSNPRHALTGTSKGDLYGVMSDGGASDNGYVYRFNPKAD